MIDATLVQLRSSSEFFNTKKILHIFDARKKKEIGYFVPQYFKSEFEEFVWSLEKKQKKEVLQRIAQAQSADPIEEGSEDDGLR